MMKAILNLCSCQNFSQIRILTYALVELSSDSKPSHCVFTFFIDEIKEILIIDIRDSGGKNEVFLS